MVDYIAFSDLISFPYFNDSFYSLKCANTILVIDGMKSISIMICEHILHSYNAFIRHYSHW